MTKTNINSVRRQACEIVSAVGAVLNEFERIESALQERTGDREVDHAVIASLTGGAAETASHLMILAQEMSEMLDAHCERMGRLSRQLSIASEAPGS